MDLSRLRVGQTLRPGQRGTRRFVERFGDRLVRVRYRYDERARRRVTTVEVVVDADDWRPHPATKVGVRVAWGEADVARRVKRAGGVWDGSRKVWVLPYRDVCRLGLGERVVHIPSHQNQRPVSSLSDPSLQVETPPST